MRTGALPGEEAGFAAFLVSARSIVMDEPCITAWFAIEFSPSAFSVSPTMTRAMPASLAA